MATLQKIRTQGPLLVIVIGLALFAFIAGDAWKIFQPHQGKQDVGEINGETVSAQDYQKLVDEYSEIVKFTSGVSALNDEQLTQIKDEVWRSYVNNKLIENEAQKLGLTVSKAEIQNIIDEGRNPILMQTPFRNPQTGAFDKDILKKFLAEYSNTDFSQPVEYAEYKHSLYNFWTFVEKTLVQDRLAEKYQNLIAKSMLSNPIEAQTAFDARTNQSDIRLAAVPYTSIVDSTITVSDSELKDLYTKKKEQYKQYVESRDIKYIDVHVTPSQEDRAAVQAEVAEYSEQLGETTDDYATFIRYTDSAIPFSEVLVSKTTFPSDVIARIDSAATGKVYGPYYNQADDSYNAFKVIAKQTVPDSIQFRQIQIMAETEAKAATVADSIYKALKGGADFVKIANIYQQTGEPTWLTGATYEKATLDAEHAKYFSALMNLGTKETANIKIGQGNIMIAQVLDRKAMKDKYKVAIVKRPVDFSKETYNKAYNNFSQFIATNGTLEKLVANAEDNGYRLLERKDFYSSEHVIGGIKGTREALKWVFEAKPGEVSQLYECGDSDHMLVVAVSGVNEEGYLPMETFKDQLTAEIRKDKKAEKIIADIQAKNITDFNQVQTLPNVKMDTVKHVTFAAPTYVAMVRASEPVLGAYVSTAELNKVSAPVKGNAGVYVFQVYNKEKTNETFDAQKEEQTIENANARMASRFINDLYKKAEVKDQRYLFF